MHQCARLVEVGEREGDAELDRRERDALLQHRILRVEAGDLFASCAIVGRRLELFDDLGRDVVLDLHAIGRDAALDAVEIGLAHVERVLARAAGDHLHQAFGKQHALRATEAAEGGVGDSVGAKPARGDARGGIEIGIIRMEHGAVADGIGKIRRIAAAGEKIDINTGDATLAVEACRVVDAEIMALAGQHHVLVAVEAAFGEATKEARGECGEAGPLRGLAFLAAEGAAHAAAFDRHHGGLHMQHVGDKVLDLRRVLRGAMHGDRTMLLRHGEAHLPFEVEMLLSADAKAFRDAVLG